LGFLKAFENYLEFSIFTLQKYQLDSFSNRKETEVENEVFVFLDKNVY